MPNSLDSTGLTIMTQAELNAQLIGAFELIYGVGIDTDPESPDGQMIAVFTQVVLDLLDLVLNVYNSFDPDKAFGVVLDQRVSLNGIQRQGGTFSVVPILVKTSQPVNLYGLDQTVQPIYTVQDSAGNQLQLQITQLGFNPGSTGSLLNFQASKPGAYTPQPLSITVPVTIVLGVASVTNPTGASAVGINEETDANLHVRRQQSTAVSGQGWLKSLRAALLNLPGMVSANVYENTTGSTDSNGVPGHSIWVVVQGSVAAQTIANTIYGKRNSGAGMKGSISFAITQVDGTLFTVFWDNVVSQNLFVKFTVSSINGVNIPNIAAIIAGLSAGSGQPNALAPNVNTEVNVNELATLVQQIDPNALVTGAGLDISSGGAFANSIIFPTLKNNQFVLPSTNVIVLPIILQATGGTVAVIGGVITSTASIASGGTTNQFSTLGGYGAMTYSMQSGLGSVNASTGLYTSAGAGTDVVKVTDALGNTSICTVAVT